MRSDNSEAFLRTAILRLLHFILTHLVLGLLFYSYVYYSRSFHSLQCCLMAVELFFQKGIGLVRPYSLASAGLVADPGVQVTLSHPPGGMASNTFRQAAVISVAFTR